MAMYTRRIKPKRKIHRTITRNPFLNPRPSSGNSTPSTPATKKQLDSFEAEYQKFINELKTKKEAEKANVEETPIVEETIVAEEATPVVEDKVEETPVEVEETKPKKTRKKKEVVVEEETDISEEPVNEVPEQTETTEA
jgi:hypothetical protein